MEYSAIFHDMDKRFCYAIDKDLFVIRVQVQDAVDDCLVRHVNDWGKIKNIIKDSLSDFLWKKIKRDPVILPIIMEV